VLSHKPSTRIQQPCASNAFRNDEQDFSYSVDDLSNRNTQIGDPENAPTTGHADDVFFFSDSRNFDAALTESVLAFVATLYDSGNFTETQIQFLIESHSQLLGGDFFLF